MFGKNKVKVIKGDIQTAQIDIYADKRGDDFSH